MKKLKLIPDGLKPMDREQMKKINGGYFPGICFGGYCSTSSQCTDPSYPYCFTGNPEIQPGLCCQGIDN